MPDTDRTNRRAFAIHGRERIHEGFLRLDVYDVEEAVAGRRIRYRREVHDHGSGSAVLPVDEARGTVLLAGQMRVPVHLEDGDGYLVEAAAGLLDPQDADPAATAIREAREELGVVLSALEHVATVYTCPGIVTERIDCFLARYGEADRVADEGGGTDADEMIDVLEWPVGRLAAAVADGVIRDAKTLILAQALMLRRPDLFGRGGRPW